LAALMIETMHSVEGTMIGDEIGTGWTDEQRRKAASR
jgi:hypothetical protein